jgi:hypothetical protein
VAWSVGAMAKGLYTRLFHWLVKKCNTTLDQKGTSRDHFIGVLDIAGFEIFDVFILFVEKKQAKNYSKKLKFTQKKFN